MEEIRNSVTADFSIVASYDVPPFSTCVDTYGIACDIGTTTIVMELFGPDGLMARSSFLNSQRRYGSDVISRIRAASLGRADELCSLVCSDLSGGIESLLASSKVPLSSIGAVTVAGNSAMCHLLLGLSVEGLGVAPFTPAMTRYPEQNLYDLLKMPVSCPVRIVPGVSAFIGGDIVAGLAALGFGDRISGAPQPSGLHASGPELFLDLGTNAEMVLACDGSFLCASAAAGPAFEGGSISCGTGSVPGAIASVRLEGNRFAYTVIGSESPVVSPPRVLPPTGLCGSGILDFLACALEAGLVKADGSLAPVCAEKGVLLSPGCPLRLTAKDIRSLQLAKAAIRAGIGTLLDEAGVREEDVARIHLAGGFGLYLNEHSALAVGLLPGSFTGKIHRAGNTSLAGAALYLTDSSLESRFDGILQASVTVQLADSPSFSRRFIDAMEFI